MLTKVDDIRAKGSEEGRTAEGIQMACLDDLTLQIKFKKSVFLLRL